MINPSNMCMFEGRIVRDPQCSNVKIGQDNVEKALFTIAVDRALSSTQRQKVKNGDQSVKTTDFIPCSLLGGQVATLKQYFPVGKAIKVVGRYTEYQTKDHQTGQTKYGHIFEIDNIAFTTQDSRNLQQNNTQQNNYQQSTKNNPQYPQQYTQQPVQNSYQQPQQQFVQQPMQSPAQQGGFTMFDESDSPF